jgi:anti-sigma B factor antagonist
VPSLRFDELDVDGVHVLVLEGELEVSTVGSVQRELIAAVETHGCVAMDGMGLTFIDSSGMRLLLSALRIVGRNSGCLVFACANPTVLRLFAVTGMDGTFEMTTSRDEAVKRAREQLAA